MAYNPGRIVGNIKLTPKHPAYSRYLYLPSDLILQETKSADSRGNEKVTGVKGFWEWPLLQRDYTIYIDEADVYFDCTGHRGLMEGYLHRFLKQHRKRNIRLVFVVQSVENLWIRARRLAQDVTLCHKDSSGRLGWMPKPLQRFVRVRYSDCKLRNEVARGFMLERDAKELFGWYDTRELI